MDLPRGTVTLLFSDIEGSTALLQQLGRRHYVDALETHRALLREAFARHDGIEVEMQGDSFHFAFPYARDAVAAAVAGQRALARHAWPDARIRVRMGLHTGEPEQSGGVYAGIDVHCAARVMGAGHGGQILLSGRTADIVAGELPEDVAVEDLGRHRLKDLESPVHLHHLLVPDLDGHFPPPSTLGRVQEPARARTRALVAAAVVLGLATVATLGYLATRDGSAGARGSETIPLNSVVAVDPATMSVAGHAPVGGAPTTVAVAFGAVWALSSAEFTIARVDPESFDVRTVAAGAPVSDLAAGFGAVWAVTRCPENTLIRIEPDGHIEQRIALPRFNERGQCKLEETDTFRGPWPNSVTAGLGAVWVVSQRDASIWRVDPRTGTVTKTFALPSPLVYQLALGVAAGAGGLWVNRPNEILRIHPATGAVTDIQADHYGGDVVTWQGHVWFSDTTPGGELRRVDPVNEQVIQSIPTGAGPRGIASTATTLWVVNAFDRTLVRVTPSGKVGRRVTLPGPPNDVAAGNGRLWVTIG